MSIQLPKLPYALEALEPHVSKETLTYHYEKHHAGYVKKLNGLIDDGKFAGKSLEQIIASADPGPLFNNAAQVWNHTFYWHCMAPNGSKPEGKLAEAIKSQFGSLEKFKQEFSSVATGQFGSGWAWLIQGDNGELSIISTANAGTPVRSGGKPLLTCDVWEHAYYIDYRNDRAKYIEAFWNVVNWEFAAHNLDAKAVTLPQHETA